MMKWSFSNIAWQSAQDEDMYRLLRDAGFTGLEIAPTRIFPDHPYQQKEAAGEWSRSLHSRFGLTVSSMQSIWYGRTEVIFADAAQREALLSYTKEAITFAAAVGCPHLVFGCPKNRVLPDDADAQTGIAFFTALAEYAEQFGTVIGIEANPPIYGTNYINTTQEAFRLVQQINRKGFQVNLDLGTMIENGEPAEILKGQVSMIHHVHISEPYLKPVQERVLHRDVLQILQAEGYDGYVSVEMGNCGDAGTVYAVMQYIRSLKDSFTGEAYGIS